MFTTPFITLFFSLLLILLAGCDGNVQSDMPAESLYYYHNASAEEQFFTVNSTAISVAAGQSRYLTLPAGLNRLEVPKGLIVDFVAYPGNSGAIINPDHQRYYAYTFYDNDTLHSPAFNTAIRQFQFDGRVYTGPVLISSAALIDNNTFKCQFYGDTRTAAEVLARFVGGEKGSETVCFTEDEFRSLIALAPRGISQLPDNSLICPQQDAVVVFDFRLPRYYFQDPLLAQGEKEIQAIIGEYARQGDIRRKYEFYSRYHAVLMKMSVHFRKLLWRQETTDAEKFSEFIQESRAVFGAGILPLRENELPAAPL